MSAKIRCIGNPGHGELRFVVELRSSLRRTRRRSQNHIDALALVRAQRERTNFCTGTSAHDPQHINSRLQVRNSVKPLSIRLRAHHFLGVFRLQLHLRF